MNNTAWNYPWTATPSLIFPVPTTNGCDNRSNPESALLRHLIPRSCLSSSVWTCAHLDRIDVVFLCRFFCIQHNIAIKHQNNFNATTLNFREQWCWKHFSFCQKQQVKTHALMIMWTKQRSWLMNGNATITSTHDRKCPLFRRISKKFAISHVPDDTIRRSRDFGKKQ